jgi:hypothetical protein
MRDTGEMRSWDEKDARIEGVGDEVRGKSDRREDKREPSHRMEMSTGQKR